jgi:hypothetical protein
MNIFTFLYKLFLWIIVFILFIILINQIILFIILFNQIYLIW